MKDILLELGHFPFALLSCWLVYRITKSARATVTAFLISFFIDIDHVVDYFIAYGWSLNLPSFLSSRYFFKNQMIIVPFHAWEIVLLLLVLAKFIKSKRDLFLAVALAVIFHLVWDVFSYKIMPWDYLLIRRILNGFYYPCSL